MDALKRLMPQESRWCSNRGRVCLSFLRIEKVSDPSPFSKASRSDAALDDLNINSIAAGLPFTEIVCGPHCCGDRQAGGAITTDVDGFYSRSLFAGQQSLERLPSLIRFAMCG